MYKKNYALLLPIALVLTAISFVPSGSFAQTGVFTVATDPSNGVATGTGTNAAGGTYTYSVSGSFHGERTNQDFSNSTFDYAAKPYPQPRDPNNPYSIRAVAVIVSFGSGATGSDSGYNVYAESYVTYITKDGAVGSKLASSNDWPLTSGQSLTRYSSGPDGYNARFQNCQYKVKHYSNTPTGHTAEQVTASTVF